MLNRVNARLEVTTACWARKHLEVESQISMHPKWELRSMAGGGLPFGKQHTLQ